MSAGRSRSVAARAAVHHHLHLAHVTAQHAHLADAGHPGERGAHHELGEVAQVGRRQRARQVEGHHRERGGREALDLEAHRGGKLARTLFSCAWTNCSARHMSVPATNSSETSALPRMVRERTRRTPSTVTSDCSSGRVTCVSKTSAGSSPPRATTTMRGKSTSGYTPLGSERAAKMPPSASARNARHQHGAVAQHEGADASRLLLVGRAVFEPQHLAAHHQLARVEARAELHPLRVARAHHHGGGGEVAGFTPQHLEAATARTAQRSGRNQERRRVDAHLHPRFAGQPDGELLVFTGEGEAHLAHAGERVEAGEMVFTSTS